MCTFSHAPVVVVIVVVVVVVLHTVLVRVAKVACGFRHSALVTASGLVLTLGHGETGRLGHGDEEDALKPKVRPGVDFI